MPHSYAILHKFGGLNKIRVYAYNILQYLFQKNDFEYAYEYKYKAVTDKEKIINK